MIPTTHIAASCLLAAVTVRAGTDTPVTLLAVTGGSLLLHFVMDLAPHGFIATTQTIFKKLLPTVIELVPGPLIIAASIVLFGHPALFLAGAFFGLLPDICAVLVGRNRQRAARIPFVMTIHRLHRKVHWFETDLPDGGIAYRFPNRPLLVAEFAAAVGLLVVLFSSQI